MSIEFKTSACHWVNIQKLEMFCNLQIYGKKSLEMSFCLELNLPVDGCNDCCQ